MKLTSAQIDQLYNFTRQHYVEWYDLQSELVDHLANAIETEWQDNQKLSLDEILNKEFQKFGVFGFMSVVEEKQKFLGKKYNLLIWKYYKEFLRLPKIIFTLVLIYGLYQTINFFESPKAIFMGFYILLLIVSFVFFLKARRELKKKYKQTQKKWLFEDRANNSTTILLFNLGFNISIFCFNKINIWHNIHSIIASSILIFIALYIFIQLKIIPQKVSKELAKTYPEYNFL